MGKITQTRMIMRVMFAVCAAGVLAAAGCENPASDPQFVLSRYLDASLHGREADAYRYLSSADKTAKGVSGVPKRPQEESPFRKVLYEKISYEIEKIDVDGNTATAKVNIISPDFGVMFRDIHAAAFGSIDRTSWAGKR